VKVLFNNHTPFMLAHGGAQVQIEQTKAALEKIGVVVEPLRWWDDKQSGDILHHFGRIPLSLLRSAHNKGMKVLFTDLLTQQGSRSDRRLRIERVLRTIFGPFFPGSMTASFGWDSFREADVCVALTPREAQLMTNMFRAPPARVHVVTNGVEPAFFQAPPAPRGPWLVCTATITERKGVLELAEAAVQARTPLWVIGKPYSETDPYAVKFKQLLACNPDMLRYEGPISDRPMLARAYREARGFVLLSSYESLSLSALEAAACECPLLLSDLAWATSFFGQNASYCPLPPASRSVEILKAFYQAAPGLKPPPRPASWPEVGLQLKKIYESLLGS
jgi:glycosyltransferase involved in cell wall biosynthesis